MADNTSETPPADGAGHVCDSREDPEGQEGQPDHEERGVPDTRAAPEKAVPGTPVPSTPVPGRAAPEIRDVRTEACAAARDGQNGHDLVTVPARQGLEAVDILRLSTGVGPVLHDRSGDSLVFLVPPGTADGWDLPGSSCCRTDGEPQAQGTGWLVPPHTDTAVTDPVVLRAALGEAARNVELAERVDTEEAPQAPGPEEAVSLRKNGSRVPRQDERPKPRPDGSAARRLDESPAVRPDEPAAR